ncbi:thiamine pyrophosphate-binding protein [Acuticoccus sediminis]|uniref:Thiamine pyrophosphate-binding protein n=1 Tax=Acuticoccus sediminis TaxID=2184697 RepID=A0A8B2NU39_9HYPH|nr:thiamine pyrophosphate-binding protein [Acuticoccus sediminis]
MTQTDIRPRPRADGDEGPHTPAAGTVSRRLRTGGEVLVDQLLIHGVSNAYCVPGESYLAVLDALYGTRIALTVCRQEGGAAMMAEASGKLTGRAGVCFVTRGPGASNAMHGLHIAQQDSTPMVLFVGHVARSAAGRDTFQELDYRAVFGTVAKWVEVIDDARRVPELVARAFRIAESGRPGPVVLALPEDMLTDIVEVADATAVAPVETYPSADQVEAFAAMLAAAERPVAVLGGSRWSAEAVAGFTAFAEAASLPVYVSFRRQMLFPGSSPCYGGDMSLGANPAIAREIEAADLVILLGTRLSEVPSNHFTLLGIPVPRQKLVHVHPEPQEIGQIYTPTLGIAASPAAFVRALATVDPHAPDAGRRSRTEAIHASYLAWSDPSGVTIPGELQMGEVMASLAGRLGPDTIFCNGAGNYAIWLHRFRRFERFGTQLAPTSGSMGYGVPAAVAAKTMRPDRTVVAFAGDGCFLMNGQEFATAVQYGLAFVVILVDNTMYGTIRMHQERDYPGRVSGTGLKNPDFAAYARAFGGHGETVRTTAEFMPALERALASNLPAILHCHIAPEALSPTMRMAEPA